MSHQPYDDDQLAEIWRDAQHRRTAEMYYWLTHFFKRKPQLKSFEPPLPLRHALSQTTD